MIFRFIFRLFRGTTCKILWKFIWNMCWKSTRALAHFNKRNSKGEFYPAFMVISITNNCNLSCKGCWVSQSTPSIDLPIEKVEKVINQSKQKGCYFFGILGGEPLLHSDLMQIFEKHSDCYFQLFSNGTLITHEIAAQLAKFGNVTPVISIEGLAQESDKRRGGTHVFDNAIEGIKICRKHKLITGVATSVCNTNYDELVKQDFADQLLALDVHYLWYYIYRPVGPKPSYELLLTKEKILGLRKFILKLRLSMPMLIVDAYWDHLGRALCPAATGISHHVNPSGKIEPCPIIQFACDSIDDGPLDEVIGNSAFLTGMRQLMSENSRGCILMDNPKLLLEYIVKSNASDTSGRDSAMSELLQIPACCSHHIEGFNLPETYWVYKFAKKHWFFGFGAYG